MKKARHAKTILAIAILIALIFAGQMYDVKSLLNAETIEQIIGGAGSLGPIVFMVIYFFVIVLFLPASVFSVIAGTLFGPLYGALYVVIAATLAAHVAFVIAKSLGDGAIDKLGSKSVVNPLIKQLKSQLKHGGFKTFFVIRCLFLPYIPVSYAAGLVKEAKSKDHFLGTLVTNAIFSPAFTYFGDSLMKGWKALILPVCLIILVLLVPRITKRILKK